MVAFVNFCGCNYLQCLIHPPIGVFNFEHICGVNISRSVIQEFYKHTQIWKTFKYSIVLIHTINTSFGVNRTTYMIANKNPHQSKHASMIHIFDIFFNDV